MKSATIQPFCRKYNVNIGCYDGFRMCPRNITERNTAINAHKNQFCLIGKSRNISSNNAIEDEIELNFKVVDIVISDKHGKSFIEYEYKPEKSSTSIT